MKVYNLESLLQGLWQKLIHAASQHDGKIDPAEDASFLDGLEVKVALGGV